ncbi:MAG: hypothetical protein A2Y25_00120 [Candidatus Melainabacteria bacterium GWF2_37_15]|nr:MAG: hypothetical protein A2Y25_00120 [Candidatus Melainabacteria bacterium GWF2_37_15]
MTNKKVVDTIPIEVLITTVDHEIKGYVHVSKYTNTNRELTDLLNDKEKRFIAVTDAEITKKNGGPPKKYDFLKVHIDYILMVHPASQLIYKESVKVQEDVTRFRELRNKLNKAKY